MSFAFVDLRLIRSLPSDTDFSASFLSSGTFSYADFVNKGFHISVDSRRFDSTSRTCFVQLRLLIILFVFVNLFVAFLFVWAYARSFDLHTRVVALVSVGAAKPLSSAI